MPRRPPEVAIKPLSEAELAELQAVLDAGDGLPSVHHMYGAFAALGTGPWLVPPHAWLPVVIGQSSLANMALAQRVLELVMRAYNSVLDALAEGREVVPVPDAPEDVVAKWCFGYFDFAKRDGEWVADEVAVELLRPFAIISGEIPPVPDMGKVRASLGRHVRELYDYWAPRRREGVGPPPRGMAGGQPPASQPALEALSQFELDEVQDVLDASPDGMATVHQMHGAFAAIATAPKLVRPREWLPLILGEGALADIDHARRVVDLVMRAYNSVIDALAQGREVVPGPAAHEDDIVDWCNGYLDVAEADAVWSADKVGAALLLPFELVAGEATLVGEKDEQGNVIEDDTPHVELALESLGQVVADLYTYWEPRRRQGAQPRPQPKRKQPPRKKKNR